MLNTIILKNGDSALILAAEIGGAILSYEFAGVSVFRSVELDALEQTKNVRLTGCYPLVPFSNRIANAVFEWAGKMHLLQRNFGDSPHAIHGNGWQSVWSVAKIKPNALTSANSATLFLEHLPKNEREWPFAFRVEQTFTLHEVALEIEMVIRNIGNSPMPCGLGWHPYFLRTPKTQLCFKADAIWENDANMLPLSKRIITQQELIEWFMPLGDAPEPRIDNCFVDWNRIAVIQQPEFKRTLRLSASEELKHLVVFTPEHGEFIAVEPVSHCNAALNSEDPERLGIKILKPNEVFHVSFRVGIDTFSE